KVEARKAGFPPFFAQVKVEQDKISTLAVVLGAPGSTAPVAAASGKRSIKQIHWYTWTLLGAGVAGLAAGGALGGLTLAKQSDFDSKFAGGRPTGAGYRQAQDLASDGKNFALGSNIAFGVGGAAMLAGAILLYR